jgi:hypothetical protein
MAAGALVVLVLVGLAAAPAEAITRDEAVRQANSLIDRCFRYGGDPIVTTRGDTITVTCVYPDGSTFECSYYPDPICSSDPAPRIPQDLLDGEILPLEPVGGPLTRPGLINRVESGGTVLAEDSATAGITETFLAGSAAAIAAYPAPAVAADVPAAAPITEPIAAPVAEPGDESIAAPVESGTEPVVAPVADAGTAPVAEAVAEPAVVPAAESVAPMQPVASVQEPVIAEETEPIEAEAPAEAQGDAAAAAPVDEQE